MYEYYGGHLFAYTGYMGYKNQTNTNVDIGRIWSLQFFVFYLLSERMEKYVSGFVTRTYFSGTCSY